MIESTDSVFVEEGEEIEEEFFSDPEQESESVFYEEIEPEIIEPNEIEQEDVFQVTSFTSEVEEAEEIPFDQEELIDAQADPESSFTPLTYTTCSCSSCSVCSGSACASINSS